MIALAIHWLSGLVIFKMIPFLIKYATLGAQAAAPLQKRGERIEKRGEEREEKLQFILFPMHPLSYASSFLFPPYFRGAAACAQINREIVA